MTVTKPASADGTPISPLTTPSAVEPNICASAGLPGFTPFKSLHYLNMQFQSVRENDEHKDNSGSSRSPFRLPPPYPKSRHRRAMHHGAMMKHGAGGKMVAYDAKDKRYYRWPGRNLTGCTTRAATR